MDRPWYLAVGDCKEDGASFALVTVLGTSGSTPRDPGSKMVITKESTFDTIGGGQLEFLVTQQARELLEKNETDVVIRAFPLAAEAAQCCGGQVSVMIETFAATAWQIAVFGAGHVAQQLIPILSRMPCQVHWFDKRPEFLSIPVEANIKLRLIPEEVSLAVEQLPASSDVLILTHDHALDYELTKACLQRDDISLVGTIGSDTKSNRFEQRLLKDGVDEQSLARFVCPIGIPQVKGKLPIEIAVSICAQLIARQQIDPQSTRDRRGISWRDLKKNLSEVGEISGQEIHINPNNSKSHNG